MRTRVSIDPGELRHQIKLQSLTQTSNRLGETDETPVLVSHVWAKIEPLTGRELFDSQQFGSDVSHKVTIRYRAGVNAAMQILYGVRIFNIVSVLNLDERNRLLVLICKEKTT